MTIRITDAQRARLSIRQIQANRVVVSDLQEQIASGRRVLKPGDDASSSAVISQLQQALQNYQEQRQRIQSVESRLVYQQDILQQSTDVLTRAKELATQGANETNSTLQRDAIAEEVFQLRNHLISLANSKYQGRYIYHGADDSNPPYIAATYTNPTTGEANARYSYDTDGTGTDGTSLTKTVNVTESVSLTINTAGNTIYDNAIYALERLGRALAGFETDPAAPAAPDGTGAAYNLPTDLATQTADIVEAIDLLDAARNNDFEPETTSVAGRLTRLQIADTLLETLTFGAKEVLGKLQDADIIEVASGLTQAQVQLEASLLISAKLLNTSILDFL